MLTRREIFRSTVAVGAGLSLHKRAHAAPRQWRLGINTYCLRFWRWNDRQLFDYSIKEKLDAISNMCVFLYVGENDAYMWHGEMEKEVLYLRSKGTNAHYTVEAGQPHRMATLQDAGAARLFDDFEQTKKGCNSGSK